MSDKSIPHGTPSAYSYHKCRCATCVESHRERGRAHTKRYRERHPERSLASQRAYRERNLERIRERDRLTARDKRAQNPDLHLEIARKSYHNNRARRVEEKRDYYRANVDRHRERDRARNRVGSDIPGNRKRQRWTPEETAVALDPELTSVEKAYMLRRSVGSIQMQIHYQRKKAMA